jgi:hypothetical protein
MLSWAPKFVCVVWARVNLDGARPSRAQQLVNAGASEIFVNRQLRDIAAAKTAEFQSLRLADGDFCWQLIRDEKESIRK